MIKVKPIEKIGSSKTDSLIATYCEIVDRLGEPNVTHLDDPDKVGASWGFCSEDGREAFIWCYKQSNPKGCMNWSTDGDSSLIQEVFCW